MRKIYDKSETWFAVIWIIIYVVGTSISINVSADMGIPYVLTLFFSIACLAVLLMFIKKNDFSRQYGLCKFNGSYKEFWYFIPLAAISTINFWNGVAIETTVGACVIAAIAKGISGIIEEIVFRGLLFVGMCRDNVKSAIIVSSLTFGFGHISNLLNGAPVFDTMCQIIYACAIGFCFTMVFKTSKCLIPCIIVHFIVNASSEFGAESENMQMFHIIATIFLTAVSVGYGMYLLNKHKDRLTNE